MSGTRAGWEKFKQGRTSRGAGWRRVYQLHLPIPAPIVWEMNSWEKKLKELRIRDDDHAIEVLKEKSEKSLKLRLWLGEYAWRKFVPLRVLDVVGLRVTVECRFPMD